LANAIKFTPDQGQIALNVVEHTKHVTVSIKDSGVGMDAQTVAGQFISAAIHQIAANNSRHRLLACRNYLPLFLCT
jgi:signal transduction histidine kinase